jgi:hypothetical protein
MADSILKDLVVTCSSCGAVFALAATERAPTTMSAVKHTSVGILYFRNVILRSIA